MTEDKCLKLTWFEFRESGVIPLNLYSFFKSNLLLPNTSYLSRQVNIFPQSNQSVKENLQYL